MNANVFVLLDLAEGPLFRFAFSLMVLELIRRAAVAIYDFTAARSAEGGEAAAADKLRLHLLWFAAPTVILRRLFPEHRSFRGLTCLCTLSLVFRFFAILVPAFMVAHVYLWERGFALAWPALPAAAADVLALATVAIGLVLFFGRLYSPLLRRIEPPWAFLKPLLLITPFVLGVLAMHPTWSPFDYHVVRLAHVLSADLVFVLVPFARLLHCMHAPLASLMPQAAFGAPDAASDAGRAGVPHGVAQ